MQLHTLPLCLGVFVLMSFTPHLRVILETLRVAQVMTQVWYGENWYCRFRWPRGVRRGSSATHLLGLRVRIPSGAWMLVVNVSCCQLEVSATGRSLVQRSFTLCICVSVCLSLSMIRCNNNTLLLG